MNKTVIALLGVVLAAHLTLVFGAQTAIPSGEYRGAKPTHYPDWFKESFLDFHEDIEEAARNGRRVVLLFHQDGCPYCNILVERNLAQKDINSYVREHFDVVALNMWGDREVVSVDGQSFTEKELAGVLQVQYTPTLIFFDERGQVALRLDGYLPPSRFKRALEYVAKRTETQMSFRAFVATQRPPQPQPKALERQPYFLPLPLNLRKAATGPARPLALLFEQTDCPNCTAFHRNILDDDVTRKLLKQVDVAQLNMWSTATVTLRDGRQTTMRQLADELEVSYAPSLVMFDAQGNEVIRSDAYLRSFHTQSVIDYVVSGGHRTEPSFQRYITGRAEALRERGIDVDIWK
jgi:thioredoxin-related protein